MIAITGASGNLGRNVIDFLLERIPSSQIIAVVRDPGKVRSSSDGGMQVRQADYNDYASLLSAFQGVNKVLQISTVGVDKATAKAQEKNVVTAAKENQVGRIIYTSMLRARPDAVFEGTHVQYCTEEYIKQSGIPYTFFRNSMYMEEIANLMGLALETGQFNYPTGNGKISFVSKINIAESISNVLIQEDSLHNGKTYEITGNKSFSFHEVINLLNKIKGGNIEYKDVSENIYRNELDSYGLEKHIIDLLVSMAAAVRIGEFSFVSDDLTSLLGRKSTSLEEFILKEF